MLKHCHNSSIRLQRRGVGIHPDSVSLHSTITVHSSTGSSESNTSDSSLLNASFSDPPVYHSEDGGMPPGLMATNTMYDRSVYAGTPDPISISSRASSYTSLSEPVGPKTTIKVFASCLRTDIEYKTLSIGHATTAKTVIWQLLSKFKMKHRDPKLFYLTLEVVIQKPGRDGLTKKTLVLDDDSKPAELKLCNPWGECRFTLQQRKGGLVKIHDSVLMEESQYKCLFISEETTVEEVILILLHCYGLEKVERAGRYCLYEQCASQRYQRKLHPEDRPLQVAALWPGPTQFSFVLRHSLLNTIEPVSMVCSSSSVNMVSASSTASLPPSWPCQQVRQAPSEMTNGNCDGGRVIVESRESTRGHSSDGSWTRLEWPKAFRAASVESEEASSSSSSASASSFPSSSSSSFPSSSPSSEPRSSPWPEVDKDSEELRTSSSGPEDMDTSLSSSDSPTPPVLTSTPLAPLPVTCRTARPHAPLPATGQLSSRPAMSFLFPSPDYASFPTAASVPSRPYSSLAAPVLPRPPSTSSIYSTSSMGLRISVAPLVPPKPTTLVNIFSAKSTTSSSACHDYENYFYI